MRSIFAAFVIALCVACSDAGNIEGTKTSDVSVRVNVTGDVSLAPDSYRLSLDGLWWKIVNGTADHVLLVPDGEHEISLAAFDNTVTPGWCIPVQPASVQGRFGGDHLKSVQFMVYCPPVEGQGFVRVTATLQGVRPASTVRLILTRTIGPPGSVTRTIDAPQDVEISVPAGLYRVELKTSSCALGGSGSATFVAVRQSETARLPLTVWCAFVLPPGIP